MNDLEKKKYEQNLLAKTNSSYNLLKNRIEVNTSSKFSPSTVDGINDLAHYLGQKGGLTQQERMIRDKRKSLDKAVLYSYQGALIKKYYPEDMELMEGVREAPPVNALINPNKLKPSYDDKVLSVGFEHSFTTGDIFEWVNTGTYWIIYLQDLTELAYFRGDIRKCSFKISWLDDDKKVKTTYGAIRGPVETRIQSIQKNGISVDYPNYSLNILIPKNKDTLKQFKRYSKFYITPPETEEPICWRIEAVDSISMKGIITFTAVEYYANEDEDDIEKGLVGGKITADVLPDFNDQSKIIGENYIKPRISYEYEYIGQDKIRWTINKKNLPLKIKKINDKKISLLWDSSYSGSFVLSCGNDSKTIIIESLF